MSIQCDLFHRWRHHRRKIDINKLNAMLMMMLANSRIDLLLASAAGDANPHGSRASWR